MSKLNPFSGIFVETGEFQINTLMGHFSRVVPGLTLAQSLNIFLNNSIHSHKKPYYGRLSQFQCAIITALDASRNEGGLTLSELANAVYCPHSKPENPKQALRAAIYRLENRLNAQPVTMYAVQGDKGPIIQADDKRLIKAEEGKLTLAAPGFAQG